MVQFFVEPVKSVLANLKYKSYLKLFNIVLLLRYISVKLTTDVTLSHVLQIKKPNYTKHPKIRKHFLKTE